MTEVLMTRHDTGIGVGVFDSVHWLFETILKEPDVWRDGLPIDSAVVFGDESYPEKIEFYSLESPCINDTPVRVWVRDEGA